MTHQPHICKEDYLSEAVNPKERREMEEVQVTLEEDFVAEVMNELNLAGYHVE